MSKNVNIDTCLNVFIKGQARNVIVSNSNIETGKRTNNSEINSRNIH